jgi:hypothetical protein
MLGEIARWHKRDTAEQALYQVKALQSRRQPKKIRKQKAAEVRVAHVASSQTDEACPMPKLKQNPQSLAGVPAEKIVTIVSELPRSGTSL